MTASLSTRTTNRSTYVDAGLCAHIRIITVLLLVIATGNSCVKGAVNAYEFRAYTDILAQQHIKHAIVAYNGEMLQSLQQKNTLRSLADMTTVHFYDVHQAMNSKNFTDFENLFYHDSPRVGIYLTQLEDVLLQEHVLGTNVLSAAGAAVTGAYAGVHANVGSRFNNSQVWFIMSTQHSVETAIANARRVMTLLPLNISADITLGVRMESNNTIQLFDIYKIQPDWLEIEAKGYWSPIYGIQLKKRFRRSFVGRRRNFKGLQLRAGIVIREKPEGMDELDYLNTLNYQKLDPMQRRVYQLMKLLEPMLNVSFQAILRESWGRSWPNGSWEGVMAMLLSREVEFTMCPMRFATNRVHLIDYTAAVHSEYVFFLFRHPRRNDIRNIFFAPFVEEVWYGIFAIAILATLLLQLHLHHESRFFLNKDPQFQSRFDYAVLSILEAFFMQGPEPYAFAATSTRTLIFFVCLFSLLLQQFYGAFIVGSLLAVAPRTVTNLEALYNSSLEVGMESVPYNFEFFQISTSPLVNAIYERICKNRERHILTIEEGAKRIAKGGFAFHVSVNRMYILLKEMLTEKEFCDLQEVSVIPALHVGLGVAKNSPFREYFTTSVLQFRTSGISQYSANQWQIPQMDCSLSQNHEVEVDLQHFLPAIMLLGAAMLLSVGVLILEILYYNLENGLKRTRFCPRITMSDQEREFIN
ncbi:glutamate receptor U1 [Anastrepha ludens]|uniref:glutamate receptor U1 n=1 Tax=Anastrepha ludens TaxID=28586 RepID=UPI0023B0BBDD|nr:glutamate receptor U1 [Anastrepha ludens]